MYYLAIFVYKSDVFSTASDRISSGEPPPADALPQHICSCVPPLIVYSASDRELSFSLPTDFSALSKLKVLYADGNPCLYSIPASLAGVQSLGVQGCNVSFSNHRTVVGGREGVRDNGCLRIRAPSEPVPSLMELAAKSLHEKLRGDIFKAYHPNSCRFTIISINTGTSPLLSWSLLSVFPCIPTTLSPWLVPRGRCLSPICTQPVFFNHYYSYLVSGLTFQKLAVLSDASSNRLPSDVSVRLDFCSQHCAHNVLSLLKTQ